MVEGWMQAGGVLQHLESYDNGPTLCDNHITKNTWIGPVLLRTPAKECSSKLPTLNWLLHIMGIS